MDTTTVIGLGSLVIAGLTMAIGSIAPAIAEGRAVTAALEAIARQPDEAGTLTRTLFVGLAMIESTAIGSIGPALAEGRAAAQALQAIAQQPDAANTITRTLFVSLAMIESTAIYCFVVAMILIFANPVWNHVTQNGG
ncbi:MAG TPA: F0F1 ATP synthase subunit C [Chondromyces sp.]|nr:F0F1 ATP synthase subunit C [Chondromyces sp.]